MSATRVGYVSPRQADELAQAVRLLAWHIERLYDRFPTDLGAYAELLHVRNQMATLFNETDPYPQPREFHVEPASRSGEQERIQVEAKEG